MRKFCWSLLCILNVSFLACAEPELRARTPVLLPDVPGYITLKGDFHLHTVFSDGYVWPTIRVEEAWRDGLDVIAITDHLEYQPFKNDVTTNHDRSFDIARPSGEQLDILVVKGSEITRDMPPGHLNAMFITNAQALAVPKWQDALEEARRQGAFIFYNHPGWTYQAPSGVGTLFPQQKELITQGTVGGVEVVNGTDYYPEAHCWAGEYNLAMLSNSDAHQPAALDYPVGFRKRPMTLVFAKEKSIEGLKEAFVQRRTAVFSHGKLIGKEEFLRPIFEQSARVLNPRVRLSGTERKIIQIHNSSDVNYELELVEAGRLNAPKELTLNARQTVLMQVSGKEDQAGPGKVSLRYRVRNVLCGPDEPLVVAFSLQLL